MLLTHANETLALDMLRQAFNLVPQFVIAYDIEEPVQLNRIYRMKDEFNNSTVSNGCFFIEISREEEIDFDEEILFEKWLDSGFIISLQRCKRLDRIQAIRLTLS